MRPKAFAIDELVVSDGESWPDSVWVSLLLDATGLPGVSPRVAPRHGRRPKISGIDRSEVDYLLQTVWIAQQATHRRTLMQTLNPDKETDRRLLVADYVPPCCAPDHVTLAMGPWDIYCDDDGNWHVRDLLQPDDIEGDLVGGWQIGEEGGLQLAEAQTNDCENPRMLDDNDNGRADSWNFGVGGGIGGTPTYTVTDHPRSEFGWLQRLQYTGILGDADDATAFIQIYFRTAAASYGVGDDCTFSFDCKGSSSGVSVLIVLRAEDVVNTGLGTQTESITLTDALQRVCVTYENLPASTDHVWASLYVVNIGEDDTVDAYFGAANIEDEAYATFFIAGNLGPGHSWSGTKDASTSSRTAAECAIDDIAADLVTDQMTICGAYEVGTLPSDRGQTEYLLSMDNSGDSANNIITILFNTNNKAVLYINGTNEVNNIGSGSLEMGDVILWCVTLDFDSDTYALDIWENDGTHYSGSGSSSYTKPSGIDRGNLGDNPTHIRPLNGVVDDVLVLDRVLSSSEKAWWYSKGRGALNARWLDVRCFSCDPWAPAGRPLYFGLVSGLVVNGDVRWRQRDGDVHFWRCYDADEEITVVVDTDDDAYPEFRITPKTAKTSGFQYRDWQAIQWPVSRSATNCPVMLGAFDLTGKAQGDGDDIRVYVDGEEVDRWLGGTLVSAVKVWVNLDFEADISLTLAEAIAAAGDIDYIWLNEDISDLPVEGMVFIGSEAFVYTDKNNRTKKLLGITREARNTSAAAHAASTAVYWIQHDVYVYYGDSSLSAPTVDDQYEPAIDPDSSTNSSWDYNDFGEDAELRAVQWANEIIYGSPSFYTADRGTDADPWEEIGIKVTTSSQEARWYVYCPLGISNVNFANGEKYDENKAVWWARVQSSIDGSSWTDEYSIPAPSADNTWESWSYSAAITADSLYTGLWKSSGSDTLHNAYVEAADVTLTVTDPVVVTASGEESFYPLECTITNTTTGEAVTIIAGMLLDQTLIVNTDEKSVALDDGTKLATAVEPDTTRRDWLRFVDGDNDLTFEETGAQEVEIDILLDRRLFE